jgi:hypothetical protein
MKRALLLAVIVCSIVPSSGCCLLDRIFCCRHWGCPGGGCGAEGCGGPAACGPDGGGYDVGPPGPPSGSVTYPYYTNRGPRDFLVDNPRSIGP